MALPEIRVDVTGNPTGGVEALRDTAKGVDRLAASYERMTPAVQRGGREIQRAGRSASGLQGQVQNAAFQIGDFAVQVGAGTSAIRAMSMQLPQLLGGFGVFGAVAGGAVAVLGALAQGFLDAGDNADNLAKRLKDVRENMDELNASIRQSRLGVTESELALMDAIAAQTERVAQAEDRRNDNRGRGQGLYEMELKAEREKLAELEKQLSQLRNLQGEKSRLIASTRELSDQERLIWQTQSDTSEEAAQLVKELGYAATRALILAGVDITTPIASATQEAARLAAQLGISLNMAMSLQNLRSSMTYSGRGGDPRKFGDPFGRDPNSPSGSLSQGAQSLIDAANKSGATGGAKGNSGLESLIETLQTEREILEAWYAESLELLNNANAAELEALGGHNEARLRLEREYQERLAGMKKGYHGTALDQAETFLGDMASALEGGNEKMMRTAKVFGAAEALINAFRAYNQVIADPSLPWFAKIPAAIGVLSAGMGMVNAIKGVSASGGGGGGSAASAQSSAPQAPAAPQTSREVVLQLNGSRFSREDVISLMEQFNEYIEDGGNIRVV